MPRPSPDARDVTLDFDRSRRTGLDEAILCSGKQPGQLTAILAAARARHARLFLTRLSAEQLQALPSKDRKAIDYEPVSRTGIFGKLGPVKSRGRVAVVAAGTSDAPTTREALRTLRFYGEEASEIVDVGVAGLWRLQARLEEIRRHPVVIVVAGMDGALPTVLGGLVESALIGVPTSTGYGVADGGRTALHAMLTSCTQGLTVCNIDNGFGAACAALRILHSR
jgi:NCAIR mutase (PurE)-related protein